MINKDTYFDILLHLWDAIKKNCLRKLLKGVLLINDNVTLHKAAIIKFLFDNFG